MLPGITDHLPTPVCMGGALIFGKLTLFFLSLKAVITLHGPALTINVSAHEAELDQRTPFCSGDEQSRGGVREAFPLQKGDAGNITSALQLEVSQPVGWGVAQRSVGAVWSFQPAYVSDVYHNSHGAVPQHYFNTRSNSTGNLSGRISLEQGAED